MNQAEVFIIESLDFEDEKAQRFEGRIISDILAMSGHVMEAAIVFTPHSIGYLLRNSAK